MEIVGANGGMRSSAGREFVVPPPVGVLVRRRPEIDGGWREVVIEGSGGGIFSSPPVLISGDWRGLPHAATLLIGARKAMGRLGGGVGWFDGSFFDAVGGRRRTLPSDAAVGQWGWGDGWRPIWEAGKMCGPPPSADWEVLETLVRAALV